MGVYLITAFAALIVLALVLVGMGWLHSHRPHSRGEDGQGPENPAAARRPGMTNA